MENSFHCFPLWKRGMKGDLTAFQKAKLLPLLRFSFLWKNKLVARKSRQRRDFRAGQGLKFNSSSAYLAKSEEVQVFLPESRGQPREGPFLTRMPKGGQSALGQFETQSQGFSIRFQEG